MSEKKMDELTGMSVKEMESLTKSFEDGTWDRTEYGSPHAGRPAVFGEVMKPVTFKEPPSVIAAIDERAAKLGSTRSDYLRDLVARDLALA